MAISISYPDKGISNTSFPPNDVRHFCCIPETWVVFCHLLVSKFKALMHAFVIRAWQPHGFGCHAIVIT